MIMKKRDLHGLIWKLRGKYGVNSVSINFKIEYDNGKLIEKLSIIVDNAVYKNLFSKVTKHMGDVVQFNIKGKILDVSREFSKLYTEYASTFDYFTGLEFNIQYIGVQAKQNYGGINSALDDKKAIENLNELLKIGENVKEKTLQSEIDKELSFLKK